MCGHGARKAHELWGQTEIGPTGSLCRYVDETRSLSGLVPDRDPGIRRLWLLLHQCYILMDAGISHRPMTGGWNLFIR